MSPQLPVVLSPQVRAVVVPLGVSETNRGLGVGLAALVHGCARAFGQGVAFAQLHAKPTQSGAAPLPIESLIPAALWHDLVERGQAPEDVDYVITGRFEPPGQGRGHLDLLVYHARTGRVISRAEVLVDVADAGRTLVAAFELAWEPLDGDLGGLRELADLHWDALESVLKAERSAAFDPLTNGPHDRLAAFAHFGRAVDASPLSRYPAARLSALAIDTALAPNVDRRVIDAAIRAMARAAEDAPAQVDLLEAACALHLRAGEAAHAEVLASRALGLEPQRPRLRVLLSEARRTQGNFEGALEATARGLAIAGGFEPLLLTERGIALAAQGNFTQAAATWRAVLGREPCHWRAFSSLAHLALTQGDAMTTELLVDHALAVRPSPPAEILRQSIELATAGEADGVARASRIERLARALLTLLPGEGWSTLTLARALLKLGDAAAARALLARLEIDAIDTLAGAEAQRERFAIDNAEASEAVSAILRAAESAPVSELQAVSVRARRLAAAHGVWAAYLASGIALRRLGRLESSREALECGVFASPGAALLFAELAGVCAALALPELALTHASRARSLGGESPKSMLASCQALRAAGRSDEADALATRASSMYPDDPELARVARPQSPPRRAGLLSRWFSRR